MIAHKVVSKSEGRIRRLADVHPSPQALDSSARSTARTRATSRSCSTSPASSCAPPTASSSASPTTGSSAPTPASTPRTCQARSTVLLLPNDPDASARALRARLPNRPAIIITDSFGRAWRHAQVDIAIGCAGLRPLEDWRGRHDALGRELKATWIAVADELAAAADLARSKDGYQPVVLIQGAERHVTDEDGPGAQAMLRPENEDLFR